jgi:hypothetical protein
MLISLDIIECGPDYTYFWHSNGKLEFLCL